MPDLDRLVFGTAALGLPYGLPHGGVPPSLMSEAAAVSLVGAAVAQGIMTFDTAPAYGVAEERLGRALGERGAVWTKVSAGVSPLVDQIEASLRRLQRGSIDLVQWHNWTAAVFESATIRPCWESLRRDERVRALGASTYGIDDARDAVTSGFFDVVQVEWNLLNQSVLRTIGADAARRRVKIALRSVYLQGALTDAGRTIPDAPVLAEGIKRARSVARQLGIPLEHLALRAALDQQHANRILLGFDSVDQVAFASGVCRANPLGCNLDDLDLEGHRETDPRTWPKVQ